MIPQSLQAGARIVPLLGHTCFLLNHFQIIIHLPTYQLMVHSRTTDDVVNNMQIKRQIWKVADYTENTEGKQWVMEDSSGLSEWGIGPSESYTLIRATTLGLDKEE
jgi:hypothetical protein